MRCDQCDVGARCADSNFFLKKNLERMGSVAEKSVFFLSILLSFIQIWHQRQCRHPHLAGAVLRASKRCRSARFQKSSSLLKWISWISSSDMDLLRNISALSSAHLLGSCVFSLETWISSSRRISSASLAWISSASLA